jgi:hypothetical protein
LHFFECLEKLKIRGIDMSTLLIAPVVAIAIFIIYRHIKGAWVGSGACHNCPSRDTCSMNPKNAKHTAPEASHATKD